MVDRLLTEGILLHHHKASTRRLLRFGDSCNIFCGRIWTIRPYSPDLALSDLRLSPALKERLVGHIFQSDEDVETAATRWLYVQDNIFYETGKEKPTLGRHGHYVGK